MYMWGNKRVDEVVENKEESKAKTKIKEKKIASRRFQISTSALKRYQW